VGRLFWKFFVSYWAALLLAVVGVAAAPWLSRFTLDDPDLPLDVSPRAGFLANTAAVAAEHGGLPALRALMVDWYSHGLIDFFAVDDQGHELLDRPVPALALSRAQALAAGARRGSEAARRVRLASGETFLLFSPVEATPPVERFFFRGRTFSPLFPLAVGMLASLCSGALLAWYVARPIRHLRGAFAALAQGRLETRVAPLMGRRRDEVADLGQHFDRMAERVQSLITAQRRLLHDVSHELRSPLARLQAAIGLARQSPQRFEPLLERIEREAVRVDELVGELLTLSRLQAGMREGAQRRAEPTDLVDLVAGIAADAQFEAQATGRSVSFSGEGEVVAEVHGELLHRAFENVVRNAVKYTREGSVVEVAATSAAPGAFVVSVADRGPGVPEAELTAIFDPFYRSASGQPGSGFGLGLAIARHAVEAHGGTIRAVNRPGGGLQIQITVPLPAASASRR
jgi:two-component system OmpR family sensor kinase